MPQATLAGDVPMLAALGSDDTGIFATDMRNEFYHLFSALVTHFGYDDRQALQCVAAINENGRIYRFDYLEIAPQLEQQGGLAMIKNS